MLSGLTEEEGGSWRRQRAGGVQQADEEEEEVEEEEGWRHDGGAGDGGLKTEICSSSALNVPTLSAERVWLWRDTPWDSPQLPVHCGPRSGGRRRREEGGGRRRREEAGGGEEMEAESFSEQHRQSAADELKHVEGTVWFYVQRQKVAGCQRRRRRSRWRSDGFFKRLLEKGEVLFLALFWFISSCFTSSITLLSHFTRRHTRCSPTNLEGFLSNQRPQWSDEVTPQQLVQWLKNILLVSSDLLLIWSWTSRWKQNSLKSSVIRVTSVWSNMWSVL